jgi:ABC-type proline/glycine betaine transport system permease subunit
MRLVAWATIAALAGFGLLGFAGLVDLRKSAFPLLMGLYAVMFLALAWARQADGETSGD